jgi:succinate dehydrogenase/fumarate reductase flavoprotein subunit
LLTGLGTGIGAVVLTDLLEAVQHLMWPGSGTLLDAASLAGTERHILVLLDAGVVTGAGQVLLTTLSSGNGIDITAAIWFSAGRLAVAPCAMATAFQRRYGLGITRPTPLPVEPYIRSGYIKSGRTLAELARACAIDPAGLERTVSDYNTHARNGEDPAFHRGSTLYNRIQGDPQQQPNPCVAPIEDGPFYAVKVVPGSFGTFAGLRTDPDARVLDAEGVPVPGLYAAGTDMASVMGGHYPAGGINLGPAMTFGYIAGLQAASIAGDASGTGLSPSEEK